MTAFAVLVALFQRRGLWNPGIAGFAAVADAAAIATLLAMMGWVDRYGFLAVVPLAYAAAKYGSNPSAMAPLAAGLVLAAGNLLGGGLKTDLLIQAGAVMVVGLMLNQRRIVMSMDHSPEPLPEAIAAAEVAESEAYLQLRENFRRLRDHAITVETRGRRDRLAAQLHEIAHERPVERALARRLRELTGAKGVVLYSAAQLADLMVVRGYDGDVPTPLADQALELGSLIATDVGYQAFLDDDLKHRTATVVLKDRGRAVGLATLVADHAEALRSAMGPAEEAAPVIAAILRRQTDQVNLERRLRETETLYHLASLTVGAETAVQACARVVDDLFEPLGLNHMAVWLLDEGEPMAVASQGASMRLLEAMSFAVGPGVAGWLSLGAPELALFDAPADNRVDRAEAIRRRAGSFFAAPIGFDESPAGFLTAGTHAIGGIDRGQLDTLRAVAAELGQALGRLEAPDRRPGSLLTLPEFQAALAKSPDGCLVILEPLRRQELLQTFGAPAFEHAMRTYARRVRGRLPLDGVLTRRPEGDFLALLRGCNEAFARSWANETAALASMIGLRTPDGSARIPFGVRAKVSPIAVPRASAGRIESIDGVVK